MQSSSLQKNSYVLQGFLIYGEAALMSLLVISVYLCSVIHATNRDVCMPERGKVGAQNHHSRIVNINPRIPSGESSNLLYQVCKPQILRIVRNLSSASDEWLCRPSTADWMTLSAVLKFEIAQKRTASRFLNSEDAPYGACRPEKMKDGIED